MHTSLLNRLTALTRRFRWYSAGLLVLLGLSSTAHAQLKIFATVPEWGALAQELGGDKVSVFTATNALQDPHLIQARPGLLARARTTNLLVATGAELEAGWLPVLQRDAGNPSILPGRVGMFEAAQYVQVLDVPSSIDRSQGHVHAAGNPHIQLDARNFIPIARALTERLILLDSANSTHYQARLSVFLTGWSVHLERWERQAQAMRGMKVWVQHDGFAYLNHWLGFEQIGVLEANPGADPSLTHLTTVLQRQATLNGRLVISSVYLNNQSAVWFSKNAKIPAVILPFTVGGNAQAKTLDSLFDDTIRRLIHAP